MLAQTGCVSDNRGKFDLLIIFSLISFVFYLSILQLV
jgi:hypothetical protein